MSKASIQIDTDNIWCYLEDLGIKDKSQVCQMYSEAVRDFMEIFDEYDAKATFFCIGKDARNAEVQEVLR